MKKDLSKKVTLSLLIGSMLFANSYALAADNLYGNEGKNDKPSNNTVEVSADDEYGDVYAAVTDGVDAVNNVATMTGGKAEYLAGAATDYGDNENTNGSAIKNGVEMSGGEAKEVAGGEAFEAGAEVKDNYVNMSGGTAQNVYGGNTMWANASGNTVTISGNAVVTGSGDNGYVDFDGSVTKNNGVYGANSGMKDYENNTGLGVLTNNKVIIKDNAKVSNAYGAYSYGDSNVSGNEVTVTGNVVVGAVEGTTYLDGQENGYVVGGYSETGNADANKVTIENAHSEIRIIAGGWANVGTTDNNEVTVNNVTLNNANDGLDIYGGINTEGAVSGNTVEINDLTINRSGEDLHAEDIIAAGANGFDQGDEGAGGQVGAVDNNTLIITGDVNSTNLKLYGGYVDNADGDATNNKVIIGVAESDRVTITDSNKANDAGTIYGGYSEGKGTATGNSVEITNSDVEIGKITGGYSVDGSADANTVTINDAAATAENIYGGYTENGSATDNHIYVDGENTKLNNIYGAQTGEGNAVDNVIEIKGGSLHDAYAAVTDGGDATDNIAYMADGKAEYLAGAATDYGDNENANGSAIHNGVIMEGGVVKEVAGGEAFEAGAEVKDNYVEMSGGTAQNVYGGNTMWANASGNTVTISGNAVVTGSGDNGYEDFDGSVTKNNGVYGANSGMVGYENNTGLGALTNNQVIIKDNAQVSNAYGAYSYGDSDVSENKVLIEGNVTIGKIVEGNEINGVVAGGYSEIGNVTGNNVIINGKISSTEEGGIVDVYSGYSASGIAENNKITLLANADVSNANLYGTVDGNGTGNELVIGEGVGSNSWSGTVNSISNFSRISFNNVKWQDGGTVLTIADAKNSNLKDTVVDLDGVNFDATSAVNVGEAMTFVAAQNPETTVEVKDYTVGKYTVGTMYAGEMEKVETPEGTPVKFALASQYVASQNNLLAENRAVAAAFVNQGTDLISDSLDTLSRDNHYGVKTFAAVYGNRSKYDVNSDLKINGWSTIVGVGSEKELQSGDFSWGVFYENGSGNYRTYNEFNNEFFRGDGSAVYNGGGIAARYEQDNGVYTEASLRAGVLKSEMDSALKDGTGNTYGYDSDTTYYGAHIGIGKVISLNESSDIDVYGKFFHTYNDGDSVTIGNGNKYEFDSITSDRLRLGARITTNKENKFSTYYGLAYEYEFNGDADMKVGKLNAETQSLQGSSYMAEIGLNYQPSPDSPWSFDLNMRGYTGERQGESFNVQATYSF